MFLAKNASVRIVVSTVSEEAAFWVSAQWVDYQISEVVQRTYGFQPNGERHEWRREVEGEEVKAS